MRFLSEKMVSMSFLKNSKFPLYLLLFWVVASLSCSSDPDPNPTPNPTEPEGEKLTIFFINDPHGRMLNFAKIQHIVDAEKEVNPTLLVSAGDLFSGSPYVDQYAEQGFPMIDIMNKMEFDISVLGNHEFDYGLETLQDRIDQSEFDWICANMDATGTALEQTAPYKTITVGDLRITLLGLIETFGREGKVIPATHPWRIEGLEFQHFDQVAGQYEDLKAQENADLYVALTHLGSTADASLANDFPFFDLIIGGHSNHLNNASINGIPTLMAGFHLGWLGKAELTIRDKELVDTRVSLIELWNYNNWDPELLADIQEYTDDPVFDEVLGVSATDMDLIGEVGCFYTTAMQEYMQVDVVLQNRGGIRAPIDQGDITRGEIFTTDPFNNGSLVFKRTVAQIKTFLRETSVTMAYNGIQLEMSGTDIIVRDIDGQELADDVMLTLGINDYIGFADFLQV